MIKGYSKLYRLELGIASVKEMGGKKQAIKKAALFRRLLKDYILGKSHSRILWKSKSSGLGT